MEAAKPLPLGFPWPEREIAAFCDKWDVRELAVFGSALREDFADDSDIDLLVRFGPGARWTLLDHARMEEELETILDRPVDLVTRDALEESHNWIVRERIFGAARTAFAR
jgi:predicted nucleotidyltransferase